MKEICSRTHCFLLSRKQKLCSVSLFKGIAYGIFAYSLFLENEVQIREKNTSAMSLSSFPVNLG